MIEPKKPLYVVVTKRVPVVPGWAWMTIGFQAVLIVFLTVNF